jgi:hypothetical protein
MVEVGLLFETESQELWVTFIDETTEKKLDRF